MSQILPFPKNKAKRVLAQKKTDGQKYFLTLSLFSFVLIAVISNEQVMRTQRPVYLVSENGELGIDKLNRAIANAEPANLFRDVEWEHQLAKRLAKSDLRVPASTSQNPTRMDQFRYGLLAGKYRIVSTELAGNGAKLPKIHEVEYVDSQEITDRPIQISDHASFLTDNKDLMPVKFQQTKLAKNHDGTETWSLLSDQGQEVGEVAMRFDESGHFLSLKVESLDRLSAE